MEILFSGCSGEYWRKNIKDITREYPQHEYKITDRNFLPKDIEFTDVLIAYRLKMEQLENARRLKYIFVPYAGVNNFPLKILSDKNIILCNSHENTIFVAERAISLILALLGKIVYFHNDLKKGDWHREGLYGEYWESIREKKISIIGTGNIGLEIARILKVFNCKILGMKKDLRSDFKLENFDFLTDNLEESLKYGEVVFLTLPLTQETERLINEKNIELLKGKYLVNVSRGRIVDEKSLYDALKNKILKGAALDVWYDYPKEGEEKNKFPSKFPIYELDNVVISPHKGAHTEKAEKRDIQFTIKNLKNLFDGKELENIVDLKRGY